MRRNQFASLLGVALLVGTAFNGVAVADSAATKVGVVNLGKVFNALQQTKDVKAKLESDQRSLKALVDGHQQELNSLKQQRDATLKPDSPQYDDMTTQLEQKSIQYDTELKIKQLDLQRAQSRQLKAIFDLIEATVTDMAKQRGLDVVLTENRPDFPPNVQDMAPDALSNLINQRNMIYVAPTVDMTNDAVTALDAKYKH